MPTFLPCLLLLLCVVGCDTPPPAQPLAQNTTLILWNWPNYMTEEALRGFERETGIRVEEHIYSDEEVLLGAIQSGDFQADLFVISESSAQEVILAQLAAELDPSLIPNITHIDPAALHLSYDPGQRFTVPYLAGTTGVAINIKHVSESTDSWSVLWDDRLRGHIAMLGSSFEIVAVAAKKLGYGVAPSSEEQFAAIQAELERQRPLLKGYLPVDVIAEGLANGDIWAAQIYSGDALGAIDRNPDLRYFVPKEGAPRWLDMLMVARASQHQKEAQLFINYLHRPEVMAKLSEALQSATPNVAAKALVSAETLANPGVYPSEEILSRCEFFPAASDNSSTARRISELWNGLTAPDK